MNRRKLSDEERRHREYVRDRRGEYPVTFRCRHSENVRVWDIDKAAASERIQRLEAGECPACGIRFRLSADLSEVIVSGGYPIRGELSARGYRFRQPDWSKPVASQAQREAELQWIRELGLAFEEKQDSPSEAIGTQSRTAFMSR